MRLFGDTLESYMTENLKTQQKSEELLVVSSEE